MGEFEKQLLMRLKSIQQVREAQHIEPSHLLYVDAQKLLNDALNALYKQGAIKVGKTINGKYIDTLIQG